MVARECSCRPLNLTPTPTATLELGLDAVDDDTGGADGRPLSQAGVIGDVIAAGERSDAPGVGYCSC